PRGADVVRGEPREAPYHCARAGHDDEQEDYDAGIAAEGKRGNHDRRQARRMNGIDFAVLAALQILRLDVHVEIRRVVALAVVVLDAQVAVAHQALRHDQVVRLVTTRPHWRNAPGDSR